MAVRIPNNSSQFLRSTASQSLSSPSSYICHQCRSQTPNGSRPFSTTPQRATRQRRTMFSWLRGPGEVFRDPLPGETNYLMAYDKEGVRVSAKKNLGAVLRAKNESKDLENVMPEAGPSSHGAIHANQKIPFRPFDLVPFPMNPNFMSERVLSEEVKEQIVLRAKEGKSVKLISVELGISMERVGAVIRLKTIEEEWKEKQKPLATPYARSIMSMLPQTPWKHMPRDKQNDIVGSAEWLKHEPINDLPIHKATLQQIFLPTSESRHFTRADAGRVFADDLLPADARIPHPELVSMAQKMDGSMQKEEIRDSYLKAIKAQEQKRAADLARKREAEARHTTVVVQQVKGRADYRFSDIRVDEDTVGPTGRGLRGVGARYGMPHEDRKKGQVKIPTRVQ